MCEALRRALAKRGSLSEQSRAGSATGVVADYASSSVGCLVHSWVPDVSNIEAL